MAEHSREWWLHESEHVFVVLLLAVVLLQAAQLGGDDGSTAMTEPVIIVPGHDAFTVYTDQVVRYPWLVVNRADEAVRVKSALGLDWEHGPRNMSVPDGVTALLVEPAYGETTALGPGDHQAFRYTFRAPGEPGQYAITLVAMSNGATIKETVSMQVVPPE